MQEVDEAMKVLARKLLCVVTDAQTTKTLLATGLLDSIILSFASFNTQLESSKNSPCVFHSSWLERFFRMASQSGHFSKINDDKSGAERADEVALVVDVLRYPQVLRLAMLLCC